MTEPNSPITDSPHTSRAAQIGWGILICVTLYVCYFSHLGAIGFVGPDEPRYAWIARDMMETGDWVTPRLYGRPWFEKPPLFYWAAALSFKIFGVSEAAARLPSAICALLATLALAWLALRLYGAETARWLLLLLPTTVGMIGFSHAAVTDMPFSGMLTTAMVCAVVVLGLTRSEDTPVLLRPPWLALVLFGFFLGLAVLAKGPAAIVLCGGTVLFWALFTKRWLDALRLLHPAVIASFCLTALPWYVLCAQRNPDFFRVFIIEHNFKRYLTPEFQHIQPFWFFVPVLLAAFLPWTGAMIWTVFSGGALVATARRLSPQTALLLSWSAFVLLFFSLSQSKLPGYILPAVPAIALLVAHSCTSIAAAHRNSLAGSILAVAFFCLGGSALVYRHHFRFASSAHFLEGPAAISLFTMAILNVMFAARLLGAGNRWIRAWTSLFALPIFLSFLAADLALSGPEGLSTNGLARQLVDLGFPANRIFIYEGMGRSQRYNLNFYLRRQVPDWDQNSREEAYVISARPLCGNLPIQDFECIPVSLSSPHEWFVSHITPRSSADGHPPGGHVQKEE